MLLVSEVFKFETTSDISILIPWRYPIPTLFPDPVNFSFKIAWENACNFSDYDFIWQGTRDKTYLVLIVADPVSVNA